MALSKKRIMHDRTSWALIWMHIEWRKYVEKHAHRHSGGVRGLMRQGPFKRNYDYELADSVSKGIEQLRQDWNFLAILREATVFWSDAAELLQQSGRDSVLRKITACGDEIKEYLKARRFGKKHDFNSPERFSIILSECRRMTDALLKEEIEGASALEHISSLGCKAHYSYVLFMDEDYEWLFTIMKSVMDDGKDGSLSKHLGIICDELKLIQKYLLEVKDENLSSQFISNHAFVSHVGSVIVRIAIQSCDFWFNRKDTDIARVKALGLVNLQHQIDHSNPEFMKLILEFQEFLSNDKSLKPSGYETFGTYFCRYILPS